MNKRVLVLTGMENLEKKSSDSDNKLEEMFNLTLPSKQRYVKKHGYDLMILRSFGIDSKNKLQRTDNHIGFLRVLRAIEMLEYYDTVMWVDGDSLITNLNYSINDFDIDEEHAFYVSWDWMHNSPYFNGDYAHAFSLGNFILNKINNTQLIDIFYETAKHFLDEQHCLNTLYFKTQLKDTIKILDHKFLGGVPVQVQNLSVWNTRSRIFKPWDKDHFLSHFTGISNEERIKMINEYYGEYL